MKHKGQFKSGKAWNGNAAGRPKGSKHKATIIKEAFYEAFDKIGGVEALATWAKNKNNTKEFYRILATLLPKDIDMSVKDESWEELKEIPVDKLVEELNDLIGKRKRIKAINTSKSKEESKSS